MAPQESLTDLQRELVLDRIAGDVERAGSMNNIPEETRFQLIGLMVGEAIREVTGPVRPSILPEPDDRTIGKMAAMQRKLRARGMPKAKQEEVLDRCLHGLLLEQRDRESLRN